MAPGRGLELVATCAVGLEELLLEELEALGCRSAEGRRGAVTFTGEWVDVWRCNWRLRTANRVLVKLGEWDNFQSVLTLTRDILNRQKNLHQRTRKHAEEH